MLLQRDKKTMRLRFKICQRDGGSSKSFSISLDDTCDWQQLQAAILVNQPHLEGSYFLSLNKKVIRLPIFGLRHMRDLTPYEH